MDGVRATWQETLPAAMHELYGLDKSGAEHGVAGAVEKAKQ